MKYPGLETVLAGGWKWCPKCVRMTERDENGACKECGNGRAESAAQTSIDYKGYQIDMSEHSGGWWYNIYPPGGEKNIGGVLSAPFDRRDQAERSAKEEVDQHMQNYGDNAAAALEASAPALMRILAESDLYAEAAPRRSPEMKEAEKQFDMPELSEARFYIRKTRALGGGWWDVTMSLPVSVNFLKAKDNQLKMNEFMKFGSSDPIEILVMMANKYFGETLGVRLGRASISTVDLKRQRAKNGIKTVTMDWQVRDALQAYALGLDLTEWSGGAELVKSKEEYQQRLKDAEQTRQQAKELREAVKAGQKTQEDWKAFIEAAKAKGMNYEVTSPDMVKSNYPAIARIIGAAPFEEPEKDETDDEDGSPSFMEKKSEAAPLPMKRAGAPAKKEEHLPVNIKRDVIKNLYSNIGEKMFGFSPEHIQWMQSAIDQMMSDSDVEKEWNFIKKGNVEKLLKLMGQIQQKAGPEDTPELEEMQGLWESIARGIIQTKQAHKEISDDEWNFVEEELMNFVDKFTDKLERKGELPGQDQDALPGGERRRLGSALTKEVLASFFLPRAAR